jgi:D-tagatose-1,6-bisphosphate aldolase subunit GatZ/KbaZ
MQALDQVVEAQKNGIARGITSICSAHPDVIETALRRALSGSQPVLIESTCNQVNQFGGYTGMMPADFVHFVEEIASKVGFPQQRLLLGGDHLGPSVWQAEPAEIAMGKARTLVSDYVKNGYTKIHLDTSMKLGDDPADTPLEREISARRAAELAAVAEAACAGSGRPCALRYVIGSEVPLPGGSQSSEHKLEVSDPKDTEQTLTLTRQAFQERGLQDAWQRVRAIVVQPGVEFGDQSLDEYDRSRASPLARFIESQPGLVYEAHSTDYQSRQALRQLVEDHFAILKVGPALTFAYREAVLALALIEEELFRGTRTRTSGVLEALESAMLADPRYWDKYYDGDPASQRLARRYSLSDRTRYYWTVPTVQAALEKMHANLSRQPIPLTLISQFLPVQYQRVRLGRILQEPMALVMDKIGQVLEDYDYACGFW